ncbi:hypothetical protein K435DRAFT_873379 [Dendrothele bispora CBS 962.96]|uniref:Uncharacterized protein n=1 Tax=Dendrothele bispora (strain CBS 962.96) TaxID=1314807 RepID=A0A4S8KZ82_DENBC|nr:hypothetical protein K435DRAFT_873379 [Dendrothele bispora CBS 962.96]
MDYYNQYNGFLEYPPGFTGYSEDLYSDLQSLDTSTIDLNRYDEQGFHLLRAPTVDPDLPDNPFSDFSPATNGASIFDESEPAVSAVPIPDFSAAATPTPAAKKRRGCPPKPKKAVVEAEPGTPPSTPASPIHLPKPVENFSAVIHVLKPDTITRNRGKNKVVKHDPEVCGSVHAPIDVSFEKLLDMIRVEMGLEDARQLCLDSLGWYFEGKKANKLDLYPVGLPARRNFDDSQSKMQADKPAGIFHGVLGTDMPLFPHIFLT